MPFTRVHKPSPSTQPCARQPHYLRMPDCWLLRSLSAPAVRPFQPTEIQPVKSARERRLRALPRLLAVASFAATSKACHRHRDNRQHNRGIPLAQKSRTLQLQRRTVNTPERDAFHAPWSQYVPCELGPLHLIKLIKRLLVTSSICYIIGIGCSSRWRTCSAVMRANGSVNGNKCEKPCTS